MYDHMVGTVCLYMLLIQKRHSFSMFNAHEIEMYVKPAFPPLKSMLLRSNHLLLELGNFPVAYA